MARPPPGRGGLLGRLRAAARPAAPPPIRPRPAADRERLPATAAQQRFWLLHQVGGAAAYNVPHAWRLDGDLDAEALARAVAALAPRHAAYRTGFDEVAGALTQTIYAPGAIRLTLERRDVAAAPDPEAAALALAEDLSREDFILSRPPLARLRLIRLADTAHLLALSQHHIICDGWSLRILMRDLSALYAAQTAGAADAARRPAPPPPRADTGDAAIWARSRRDGAARARDTAHWRDKLANLPPPCIPPDAPGGVRRHAGARVEMPLDPALGARLRDMATREGRTEPALLLAATLAMLHRQGGATEIAVALPVAGRDGFDGAAADIIGAFVNTVVLRVDLSGAPSFRTLTARVSAAVAEALAHQSLPFEEAAAAAAQTGGVAGAELISLAFTHFPDPLIPEFAGVAARALHLRGATARFALTFGFDTGPDGLRGYLEYDSGVFTDALATRLAARWRAVLDAAIADPGRAISTLPAMTPAELARERTLGACAPPPRHAPAFPPGRAIDAPGEDIAVIGPDATLTRAALDAAAERVAAAIRAALPRDSGPEPVIALRLGRRAALPAVLTGALRAGAAFMSIDPGTPPARAAHMLRDSGARLMIADAPDGGAPGGPPVLDLATILAAPIPSAPIPSAQRPPSSRAAPDALAYVIYTSGSTGAPKGVAVERRAMAALFAAMAEAMPAPPGATWLALAPSGFDIALWELLGPLASGARLVIASGSQTRDPEALIGLIRRHRVTDLHATPTTLRMLLDAGLPRGLRIVSTGEALPGPLAARLLARATRLVNLYGPTEATIWATRQVMDSAAARHAIAPIGAPLPGYGARILGPDLQPVPPGMIGELALGGPGLARGYLNLPERTAQSFVAEPETGARLYLTGDLARRLPDGTIAFLGRRDRQVKLRGNRIEIGEIERALECCAGVAQAAAALIDIAGDPALAAAIRPAGAAPDPESLRAALAERLPGYMIPQRIVFVGDFPRTAADKTDLKALFAAPHGPSGGFPGGGGLGSTDPLPGDAPFVEIWASLTGAPPRSRHSSFLTSGGSSIMVLRLMAELERRFGRRPALSEFFDDPTIAGLARMMAGATARAISGAPAGAAPAASPRGPGVDIATLQPGAAGRAPLVLAPNVDGNGSYAYNLLPGLPEDLPVWELRARSDGPGPALVSPGDLAAACAATLIRELARRRGAAGGPQAHLAGFSYAARVAWDMGPPLAARGVRLGVLGILDIFALPSAMDPAARPPATAESLHDQRLRRREMQSDAAWPGDLAFVQMDACAERGFVAPDGGWRDLADGRFCVTRLRGEHVDLVSEPALARAAAAALARAIAACESSPAPVGRPDLARRGFQFAAFAALARGGREALLDHYLAALAGGAPWAPGPPPAWVVQQAVTLATRLGAADRLRAASATLSAAGGNAGLSAAGGDAGLAAAGGDAGLSFALSRLHLTARRGGPALKAARRAVALAPDAPVARLHLARVLRRRKRHDDAIAAAREALALRPWAPRNVRQVAEFLLNAGQAHDAAPLARWLAQAHGEAADMQALLARCLKATGAHPDPSQSPPRPVAHPGSAPDARPNQDADAAEAAHRPVTDGANQ